MHLVLNMPKFWLWQSSEYGKVLNIGVLRSVLNIPEYIPWQSFEYILGSKYARILNIADFWICKRYIEF